MQRLSLIEGLLFMQTVLLFVAIGLTSGQMDMAGGGLDFGRDAFLYVKIVFLFLPILTLSMMALLCSSVVVVKLSNLMRYFTPVFAFILWALVTLCFAVTVSFSALKLAIFVFAFLSFCALLCLYLLWGEDKARVLLERHVIGMLLVSLALPLVAVLLYGYADLRESVHALPYTIHANELASFYAFGGILVWLRKCHASLAVWFLRFALPVVVWALFSRSVLFALVLSAGGAVFLLSWWYRDARLLLLLLLAVLLAVCCLTLIHSQIIPLQPILSSISRFEDNSDLFNLTRRTEVWQALWREMNFKVLMVGNGFAVMREQVAIDMGSGYLFGAHNVFLAVLTGTGLIGLGCFLWFWGRFAGTVYRQRFFAGIRDTACFVMVVMQALIHGMTSTEFGHNLTPAYAMIFILFWILQDKRSYHAKT